MNKQVVAGKLQKNLWNSVFLLWMVFLFSGGCNNNPYGSFPKGKTLFSTISDDPRTLDPIRVSDTSSNAIASNLHDTPYQYHYLKRPLTLIPAMAVSMPVVEEKNINGRQYETFRFSIKKGLRYHNDPCFEGGRGREIKIDDIIFSIKRAADLAVNPFGYPLLTGKVEGFDDYSNHLNEAREKLNGGDLTALQDAFEDAIPGVRKIDDYTLEMLLTEPYPQIIYFFSLSTGSPVPKECYYYYNGKNGHPTYDRHPVTSGPFYLAEWRSKYRITLKRNPSYRKDDFYPESGNPGDGEKGLLKNAGKPLPIMDEIRFQMVEAPLAGWTLFEQGYLDRSGIPKEVFGQVIQDQGLSQDYVQKGIRLDKDADVATFWWYFNMQDPLFKNNRALRQAISLAVDREEMLDRFYNNRGVVAQSIIPPGIEGYFEDFKNPYSDYNIELAKKKLIAAGYPGGIDPETGRALQINLTLVASSSASSLYNFYIDQLRKINIDLKIDSLDWPTVIEKKIKKNFQMIHGGWHADYPDPQNFLQLYYGPNISGTYNENYYQNSQFDTLYEQMRNMVPGSERQNIIRRMNQIVAEDAHVVYLFHPLTYGLSHKWVAPLRPHPINTNQLKYRDLDADLRKELVEKWNRPPVFAYVFIALLLVLFYFLAWAAMRQYRNMGR